jgi:glycopeptide antibiotics resistance protein
LSRTLSPSRLEPHCARLEPHYAWIAAGIAVLILYGSFYPFFFYLNDDPRGPLGVLLGSGFRPDSLDDVVANVLLYLPLGFFVAYALQRRTPSALAGATAAGFALSLLVELVQFYDLGRVQELTDICSNTAGALLGAAGAVAARRRVSSPYLTLVLVCWLGNRWYPAMPPTPAPLDLFRYFGAWLAVGLMLEALLGASPSRVALPVLLAASLLVRALTVAIEPFEIAGGAAAALLWTFVLWRLRARATIVAGLFVVLAAVLALAPFHFSATARAFGWVPFRSFLEAPTDSAIRAFFEKAFFYGGMVWLLVRSGFSIGRAAVFGATLVFCLRLSQVYLPGRSAEITDTILVLMLAAMMKLVSMADGNLADSGAPAGAPAGRSPLSDRVQ